MSFKENLKARIKLDSLLEKLVFTMREAPETRWLDKALTQELLDMTDFEPMKARNLHLYTRPLEGEIMEVLVLDNELPIYHTAVTDVALRKSPHWRQVFSIRNIKKIMNDQDVIASTGKESLKRLHAAALALLLRESRQGLEQKSIARVQESLDLFFKLLDFQPLSLEVIYPGFHSFARPKVNGGVVPACEHLILFDEKNLALSLKKGAFSPQNDADLAWVLQYARGEGRPDLQGAEVFEFLAELALEKAQTQRQ